uniref:Uncharacterized protein n=1 Tax=Aegilops tauschii TaxID=37682 RepID=N1QRG5_AEGTA
MAFAPAQARSLGDSPGTDADCGLHRRHLEDGGSCGFLLRRSSRVGVPDLEFDGVSGVLPRSDSFNGNGFVFGEPPWRSAKLHINDVAATSSGVKRQVALLGLAKPFQMELNEIAEKVEASNQRWYKFILTETICALNRHNDCCVSSSLSADVKVGADSWEEHFDKISLEERSKFDEETLYNLDGIKGKKVYSKKPDGFSNEYIVENGLPIRCELLTDLDIPVTILVAADGALKFPKIKRPADLVAVLEKLNSISASKMRGVNVLWTPQEENDVLSEERLLADYPNLKALSDY